MHTNRSDSIRHNKCVLGGTFSLLHKGHKYLLSFALKLAKHVVIGITTEEYLQRHPKRHPVEPFDERALKVLLFCLSISRPGQIVEIVPLSDPYGPSVSDPDADCIVVSEETFPAALEINAIRSRRGLKPLEIYAIEMVPSSRGNKPLSSSELWLLD